MILREVIEAYVLWRRAHGAKFTTGAELLRRFLDHADEDAACDAVTTAQVLAYLASASAATRHRENRYYALAGFWRHAISRGHAMRSPMPADVPRSPVRAPPYIYSRDSSLSNSARRAACAAVSSSVSFRCTPIRRRRS
jgi:hypothetical protein